MAMRGAGWIRGLREAEARELRREIDQLELDLIEAANSKGKGKLHDIAHTLRWQKARLDRLEECLAAMPTGKSVSA
jgi:ribosome biogenesis protein Nip4